MSYHGSDSAIAAAEFSSIHASDGFSRPAHPSTAVTKMPTSTDELFGTAFGGEGGSNRSRKGVRKRPRASRRTPTTLLNTDASNFRAMVQQFTGVPSVPYTTSHVTSEPSTFGFGIGFDDPVLQATVLPIFAVYEQQMKPSPATLPVEYPFRSMLQEQEMIGLGRLGGGILQGERSHRPVGHGLPEGFSLDTMGGHVAYGPVAAGHRGDDYFCEYMIF
ncbi:hypothetical protein HPP92_003764 [Vanilla planifolia]|uniref:VQ domain-containing protein n=1 Tax=Vanilla planifolia TaxID=51239 RepID=A0A835S3W5_VANPL|nr:hypothetical protein HPP92_004192 [Vanilla planifolia]KAG0503692.1 hypothetical protein HPP92_003764 [Vanilla planifolia]